MAKAREVVRLKPAAQAPALLQRHPAMAGQMSRQAPVEADPNFEMGRVQPVEGPVAFPPLVGHGQRAGLEPAGAELPAVERQEHVEGVVDPLVTAPAVVIIPGADLVAVEPVKFGGEHGIHVLAGVAAQRAVAGIRADVLKVVETGEQADPGDKDEADYP